MSDKKIGLVITTYNRPDYVECCFASLRQSNLQNTLVVIVDDASSDKATLELIEQFTLPEVQQLIKLTRQNKHGFNIHESLKLGWDLLHYTCQVDYLCNLDSDAIVKPHWLETLQTTYIQQQQYGHNFLLTGFNTMNHPIREEHESIYIKESFGGINTFFAAGDFYENTVRPCLSDNTWDWQIVHTMAACDYPVLCTKPSVVQHIGQVGENSTLEKYDFAAEF